jgi:hypothetical protein
VERIERVLTMLERTLNTKRKRHLAGGVLLSISLLFGGLAVTVITLKTEEIKDAEFEIM